MAQIKLCYRNILENSTVTSTSENASFPKSRLYDRDIGKLFKGAGFGSPFVIGADQGATTIYDVDRLIIPAGHNLNGLFCELYYSANYVDWFVATSWTQGDALLIDKSFTSQNKRYWELDVTAPARIVEMPEMFLSKIYTFERNPTWGSKKGEKKNIQRDETQSGRVRRVKFGDPRLSLSYEIMIQDAQKTNFESWDSVTDGTKYFWLWDEDGTIYYMELLNDLIFNYRAYGIWGCALDLLEVL